MANPEKSLPKPKKSKAEKFESISVPEQTQEYKYDLIDSFNHIFKKKIPTEVEDEDGQLS